MPFVASSILWIPHIKERQRCLSIALTHMEVTVLFLWKDWLSNPWWGYHLRVSVVVVQSLSHVDSLRPYGLQHASLPCPSPTPDFLKLMSIKSVMPSNHLILCHPLLLLPSIFPSITVFSDESALPIRWAKNWSFSFSLSPFDECSGLISFKIDWLDLFAVQGTLKSLF